MFASITSPVRLIVCFFQSGTEVAAVALTTTIGVVIPWLYKSFSPPQSNTAPSTCVTSYTPVVEVCVNVYVAGKLPEEFDTEYLLTSTPFSVNVPGKL